jgi:hypothetical protein
VRAAGLVFDCTLDEYMNNADDHLKLVVVGLLNESGKITKWNTDEKAKPEKSTVVKGNDSVRDPLTKVGYVKLNDDSTYDTDLSEQVQINRTENFDDGAVAEINKDGDIFRVYKTDDGGFIVKAMEIGFDTTTDFVVS